MGPTNPVRRPEPTQQKTAVLLSFGFILLACVHGQVNRTALWPNGTVSDDVSGLLQFKAEIQLFMTNVSLTVLSTWDDVAGTDPCITAWKGVLCSCADLPPAVAPCVDVADPNGQAHVLGVDLGPVVSATFQPLQGPISTAVSQMTSLTYLDLSGNRLQ